MPPMIFAVVSRTISSWLANFIFKVLGAVLFIASFFLFFITFRENTFLSPAVRVQTDRAQTVVSTGPYRYVRHPMYAAFVVFAVGSALLLGSWYGVAGAVPA